jgi:hypothetical protein
MHKRDKQGIHARVVLLCCSNVRAVACLLLGSKAGLCKCGYPIPRDWSAHSGCKRIPVTVRGVTYALSPSPDIPLKKWAGFDVLQLALLVSVKHQSAFPWPAGAHLCCSRAHACRRERVR